MFERLNLALRHERIEFERQARSTDHFIDRCGDRVGQAETTVFRVGGDAHEARVGQRVITIAEPRSGAHDTVFQNRRMQVAGTVQGRDNLFADPARLGQHGLHKIA